MVSQAIDERLFHRIQKYVATDINSRMLLPESENNPVKPEDVFVLSFSRVANNWQATATAQRPWVGKYELTHDGSTGTTICKIYHVISTHPAII